MTRLQNAQKQVSEALAALESAADQIASSASLSQTNYRISADSNPSTLVEEVSIIEAKLGEAITMIASIESVRKTDGDTE